MKNTISILLIGFLLSSCVTSQLEQALTHAIKNSDWSYLVMPEFRLVGNACEEKLTSFYTAEKLVITAEGTHSFDSETMQQTDEKCWLKSTVLNSSKVQDIMDKNKTKVLAKKIAVSVLKEVKNKSLYEEIEIEITQQLAVKNNQVFKQSYSFAIADLEKIEQ